MLSSLTFFIFYGDELKSRRREPVSVSVSHFFCYKGKLIFDIFMSHGRSTNQALTAILSIASQSFYSLKRKCLKSRRVSN